MTLVRQCLSPTSYSCVVRGVGAPKGAGLYTSVDVSCPRAHIKSAAPGRVSPVQHTHRHGCSLRVRWRAGSGRFEGDPRAASTQISIKPQWSDRANECEPVTPSRSQHSVHSTQYSPSRASPRYQRATTRAIKASTPSTTCVKY